MIVKILSSTASFSAVTYNTGKIDRNKGELMKAANFGPLQALGNLRPADYINYFKLLSAQNKRVSKPQFHAVISAKGKSYDKDTLSLIADKWLMEMGYGNQPYLIIFHRDTDNNHIHMISARVDRDGKKVDSAFEKVRAIGAIQKVLGYEYASRYNITTRAQYMLLLEQAGYPGNDPAEKEIGKRIAASKFDTHRTTQLKMLFMEFRSRPDFAAILKEHYNIELIFHSSDGKMPYGYTIIDHESLSVYKGSEIMSLKLLTSKDISVPAKHDNPSQPEASLQPLIIESIQIADDVDDQQIHGMRRKRQRKARTNTR